MFSLKLKSKFSVSIFEYFSFRAKRELETFESTKDAQITRKDMELKLLQNEVKKLTTQLEQKTTENTELVTICEQLM